MEKYKQTEHTYSTSRGKSLELIELPSINNVKMYKKLVTLLSHVYKKVYAGQYGNAGISSILQPRLDVYRLMYVCRDKIAVVMACLVC